MFIWEEFVNVCCDPTGRFCDKVRNLAVEPEADSSIVDAKKLALAQDDFENAGEKIILEGGLF